MLFLQGGRPSLASDNLANGTGPAGGWRPCVPKDTDLAGIICEGPSCRSNLLRRRPWWVTKPQAVLGCAPARSRSLTRVCVHVHGSVGNRGSARGSSRSFSRRLAAEERIVPAGAGRAIWL